MKVNKKISPTLLSAAGTFALLKLPHKNVDPYTRAFVGTNLGLCTAVFGFITRSQSFQTIGFGIALGGLMTLEEVARLKGAKIVRNNYKGNIYTLHETEGIRKLLPGTIPDYRIDGLVVPRQNLIFKAHDGIYLKINTRGIIQPTTLTGSFLNSLGAGFKSKAWAEEQAKKGDPRWLDLYNAGSNSN